MNTKMVLLFLFYINVCIMANQVSTQSAPGSSQDYLKRLELATISNDVFLNANEKSIVELQRSVKELAGMERKQRQLLDYYGCKYSWKWLLYQHVSTCIIEFVHIHNLNLSESTRRHLDLQNRTITGTQSNETEASCARLAPSNGYVVKELLTDITNELTSNIRPGNTETH
ncbi:hypothetical protein KSF78_0009459 [Schistosoma japonicum]|nr:hypothetical protein KSF78_0009459 [Schistosoma japonicum]